MTLACSQGHSKIATQLADTGLSVNEPNNVLDIVAAIDVYFMNV